MRANVPQRTGGSDPYCVTFRNLDNNQIDLVGGKNASLGELTNAGVSVPPGFAVTTQFYRTFMTENDLWDYVQAELDTVEIDDATAATDVSQNIRRAIEDSEIPPNPVSSLEESWQALRQECEVNDPGLAVRSSATAEDLPDASFAGQQDTYLNVHAFADLKTKVKQCISSLFTPRAIAYREKNEFDHDDVEISVGVQKLVNAKCAGVMFTLNPRNGDRSKVQIEGNWGLGESVVSGEVNPDNFLVDKAVFEIVDRNIATKTTKTDVTEDGVEETAIEPDKQDMACITDDEIIQLTEIGKNIEKHYGTPQDVEWVIDSDRRFPTNIFIVQSRPETVWSQKDQDTNVADESEDSLDLMMDTLSKTY
jgi:pyruvate,water dikinase